jgi:hypothetical protein
VYDLSIRVVDLDKFAALPAHEMTLERLASTDTVLSPGNTAPGGGRMLGTWRLPARAPAAIPTEVWINPPTRSALAEVALTH